MNRFLILLKSVKIVKNWYIIPLVYFHIYRNEHYILKLKNGLKIKLRNNSTDIHAFVNIWVIQEYSNNFDKNEETIIDVGGHIGLFSIYALRWNPKKIIAFEPIKENFNLFNENIALNKIKNIKCYNMAVYDSSEEIEIYLSQDFAAHSLVKKNGSSRKIKSISLKKIFDEQEITKCDILKLDCEGSEYKIFDELPNEYFKKIEKISMEFHIINNENEAIKKLKKRFIENNFSIKVQQTNDEMGMLYANIIKNV